MALDEDIAGLEATHNTDHSSLHLIHNQDFNLLDRQYYAAGQQPGNGNVSHDMTALANVLADVTSGTPGSNKKQKRVIFPGGRNWRVNSTIQWPEGVHKIGGPGSDGIVGRSTQFLWDGAAGGTMFDCVTTGGGRINNMLVEECIYREGLNRPGKWWEIGDEIIGGFSGVDQGTVFRRCQFYNADAPAGAGAFDVRFGPTNFFMDTFRMDNWSGAAIRVAVNNAASHVFFGHGTFDNGGTLGGFPWWFDGTGAGSNKSVFATLFDWKIEVNSAPVGEKAVVLATLDHTASQGIQHFIDLIDFHIVPAPGAGTDFATVGARRTDAADTRMIQVHAHNCQQPGAIRLIDGVVDPPSYGSFSGRKPNWSYTPQGFGFASPGGEGVLEDYLTQARYRDLIVGGGSYSDLAGSSAGRGLLKLHNALAVPSANPVGGGFLYVEGGALKYRGTSGTVTTLGPA